MRRRVSKCLITSLAAFGIAANSPFPEGPSQHVLASIDLAKPFQASTPWRFTATQGPDDFVGAASSIEKDKLPGTITLCIHAAQSRQCDGSLSGNLDLGGDAFFDTSHYLRRAEIVRPKIGSLPLLIVQSASLPSGDGDMGILTQIVAYDRHKDRFRRIYRHVFGTNNNGEDRYIMGGPLKGGVIEAEQTADGGRGYFGYWITVRKLTAAFEYRAILKYRSATRYGDGNPLAVIDSEMPNILQRLGLWRQGQPVPAPSNCPHQRLVQSELWCT